jgi:hypothetical protein
MIPAPPRAIASAAIAWDIMQRDVEIRQSLMTTGFNEQRQRDLNALAYEDRQKGNSGYYLHARVELEISDTDGRAKALYEACCEVWERHGQTRNRAFYRAVFDNCLQSLFATRLACVKSELDLLDERQRQPGRSSAAQGSLHRRMDQLRATWNQTLEREARDSDTRERVARERAVLLPRPQVQSAPAVANRQGNVARNTIDNGVVALADDRRSIQIAEVDYPLTKNQGLMMSVLLEAHSQGKKFVAKEKLCEAVGTLGSDPRNSWRNSSLWLSVVKSEKGRYWLDLPTAHTPVLPSGFDRENTS